MAASFCIRSQDFRGYRRISRTSEMSLTRFILIHALVGTKGQDSIGNEYWMNCMMSAITDHRQSAVGFDFGVETRRELAIEVKGLKRLKGDIQFTDREWAEAKRREANYWLVVVGNLANPMARVIRDPYGVLDITCNYQRSVTVVWRSVVSV